MAEAIFRGAYRPKGVSPSVVADELTRLYHAHGKPTAADVVEAARPKTAPLHPAFEWDNKVAGEAWRQYQAGQMVRAVYIKTTKNEPSPIRMFLAVETDGPRAIHAYIPTEEATPEQINQVIDRWMDDISALERRLEALGLFTGRVPAAMHELQEAVAEVAA